LGIAVLGSIGAAVYGSSIGRHLDGLSGDQAHDARQGLAGAVATSANLSGSLSQTVLSAARTAFTDGMNVVAWVGAAVLIATAVATVTLLRGADRAE
jgi:DHA2 family multidrug resistance protein-like MFS transporter